MVALSLFVAATTGAVEMCVELLFLPGILPRLRQEIYQVLKDPGNNGRDNETCEISGQVNREVNLWRHHRKGNNTARRTATVPPSKVWKINRETMLPRIGARTSLGFIRTYGK